MRILLLILAVLISTSVAAQEKIVKDAAAVQSIDGIVKEVLRFVSREKGKMPDWNAFRNLFLPTATFTVLNHSDVISAPLETVSLDEFVQFINEPDYDQGFLEYEIHKVVNEYNGIAQVFQSFQAKEFASNNEGSGINSYQLVYFSNRWWVASIVWTTDGNGVKIPKKYRKN